MGENNGFLTSTDKEFLQTDEEYYTGEHAKQSRYERRRAIAERARQAFHDFRLLYETLDEDERDRIFDIPPVHDDPEAHNQLSNALSTTMAFLYRSLEGDLQSGSVQKRGFRAPFGEILTQGVKMAESDRYQEGTDREVYKLHVKFEYEQPEIQAIGYPGGLERSLRKLARGAYQEMTEKEMSSIFAHYRPGSAVEDLVETEQEGFDRLNDRLEEIRQEMKKEDE